ncbi:cytochrome P450 [Streptosporangium sandarakinum]
MEKRMPFERESLLDLPDTYRELRATEPVARVRTYVGDPAWLVSGYEEARQALSDPRLGRSSPDPERSSRISDSVLFGGPRDEIETEKSRHQRMRRMLTPAFSARRMGAMRPRVQELVDGLLDRLAELPKPVDLHEGFSVPLPILVICELLGVPYEDRDHFRKLADEMGMLGDPVRAQAAMDAMTEYTGGILAEKRARPAEDVFSDLATMDASDEEAAKLAGGLLFAGHETTVSRIDYGVLLLLANPEQRDALVADPSLADAAVEEILRLAAPSDHGLPRYAQEPVTVGGVAVEPGEAVVVSIQSANRDERVFPDPDRFDLRRPTGEPHVGFGYGPHFCIGASLARVELRTVFGTLFRRFPTLALAVPMEEIQARPNALTGGLTGLPVTW